MIYDVVRKNEIYYADLGDQENNIVVIIQNDIGNKYSTTTIVAVIEFVEKKPIINFNKIYTIEKKRLTRKINKIIPNQIIEIGLRKSLFKKEDKENNRGKIVFVNLEKGIGSEQSGKRPVILLQNKFHNNSIIVAMITSVMQKRNLPVHYVIDSEISKLPHKSIILLEQLKSVNKDNFIKYVSQINDADMMSIDNCLKISLGINF